jgi:hypothetical protein
MEKHELELVTSTCTMSCNVLLHDCTRHNKLVVPEVRRVVTNRNINRGGNVPYTWEMDLQTSIFKAI